MRRGATRVAPTYSERMAVRSTGSGAAPTLPCSAPSCAEPQKPEVQTASGASGKKSNIVIIPEMSVPGLFQAGRLAETLN